MKKIVIAAVALLFFASTGVLYSLKKSDFQVIEVLVCEEGVNLAEMIAKVSVNREELLVVSYCSCEGIDPSFKPSVKKTPCDPPKDMVYSCTCVGKTHY
ncbi:MAG: hypothetical protein JW807_08345 [Spirochaetes bacterium]|nr:hypothetical protein [Spirochaetota bacterium]